VSIRRYRVVAPPSPSDFQDFVYTVLSSKRRTMEITAELIPDELSQRRQIHQERASFTFRILILHTDPHDFSVEVEDTSTKKWSHIVATEDEITFTVVE